MAEPEQEERPVELAVEATEQQLPLKLIVVTGFGPFVGHEKVNASWEAVRLLPDIIDHKGTLYKLEKQMVPVEYAAVDKAVEEIWLRQPELVIHCGVHGTASCILVEKLAYNHKFHRPDYAKQRLRRGTACLSNCNDNVGNDVICCGLNVNKIVAIVSDECGCQPDTIKDEITLINVSDNSESVEVAEAVQPVVKASTDVGNYLCGYIYLKSLDRNRHRTLFVHVPPIDRPFSSAKTAEVVLKIVDECVHQLVENDSSNS